MDSSNPFCANHGSASVIDELEPSCVLDDADFLESESPAKDSAVLLRSRFSDDDIDGIEMEEASEITGDLREKINRSRKKNLRRRSGSSGSYYREIKNKRKSSHHESRSYYRSRDRRRSRSKKKYMRSRSYEKFKDKYERYQRSISKSKSRSPKTSADRKSENEEKKKESSKTSYYKKNNLDIEIHIKNDHKRESYVEKVDEASISGSTSPCKKKYPKSSLETHDHAMMNFKQSLEEKFQFSVDSIVKQILSTKSTSEIKDMLNVDISEKIVPENITKPPMKGKMKKTKTFEKCIHCDAVFLVTSSPAFCQICHKPQEDLPSKTQLLDPCSTHLKPSRFDSFDTDFILPGPMPPGPMPPMPPQSRAFSSCQSLLNNPPMHSSPLGLHQNHFSSNSMLVTPILDHSAVQPGLRQPLPPAPLYSNNQAELYKLDRQPMLPVIRGHVLVSASSSLSSGSLDSTVITKKKDLVTTNLESKDKSMDNAPLNFYDSQSFDYPVTNMTNTGIGRNKNADSEQQSKQLRHPSDIMKTLVRRN